MSAAKPIFTQDPSGNVMVGEPIQPAAAYPKQVMPDPVYYQPPKAFYHETGNAASPASQTKCQPPPFYYGPSAGAVPGNPYKHPCGVAPGDSDTPYVANTTYSPSSEVTEDFACAEHNSTSVAVSRASPRVTHLNFHDNRLTSLARLDAYPNLLRLTASWNDLTSLSGVESAQYLRWIDVSGNHIVDFTGLGSVPALEWLNLTQSDVTSLRGLGFAPNLTWLCLHHNRFHNFAGIEKLPQLEFLDVSDNEVKCVEGLERCVSLREINICNNPLCEGDVKRNLAAVKALSALPNLQRLNINDTFYDPEEEQVVAHFRKAAPHVEVITTPERTAQLGHNYKFKGKDVTKGQKKKKKGKCCCS